jgi:polysaccharide biosynthesis transport protein
MDERQPTVPGSHPGHATAAHQAARTPAMSPGSGSAQNNLHIYDRLGVVVKYWKAVAVVFIIAASVVLYRAYSETPLYLARVQILIEEETKAQAEFKEAYVTYTDPEPYYKTQYRLLRSRELVRRAIKRLNLETVPEYNGQGPEPTPIRKVMRSIKRTVVAPFSAAAEPPTGRPAGPVDENRYVDSFISHLQVEPVQATRLVDVVYRGPDPVFAAKALNVLAEEYVSQNLERRLADVRGQLDGLTAQMQQQQQIVLDRERDLYQYREQHDALSLDDKQDIVGDALKQVNDNYLKARLSRMEAETLYSRVTAAGTEVDTLANLLAPSQPGVQALRTRVNDLEEQRAKLLLKYFENHPNVRSLDSQIGEVQAQLKSTVEKAVETIRINRDTAKENEQKLAVTLDQQKNESTSLGRKNVDYSELERQAETERQLYQTILTRQKELSVIANNRQNNVSINDKAEVPQGPVSPDTSRAWLIALLVGMAAGVGSAFALDYLDDTVKTPDDIRWRLKVHFLGLVPKVRGNNRPLLSESVPPAFGEAFRALRTALVIRSGGGDTRTVAITSAQPLEGKTTTAVNTALALAIGGARVLLIDADMRRPSVHKALRMSNQKGLAELLQAQVRMREVVRTTVHPNLLAISAGSPPTNPSELLASDRMRALLQQLEQGPFDWVIIDTPPVLAVTDAVIVAPLVSAVAFVVGAEMTRWRLAERAIETLQSGNPRSISAVLNRVDFDRNRYYYTRYYGQHYYSYYAEDVAAAS